MESAIIKRNFVRDCGGSWINLNIIEHFDSLYDTEKEEWTVSACIWDQSVDDYENVLIQDDFSSEEDAQGFLDSMFEVKP